MQRLANWSSGCFEQLPKNVHVHPYACLCAGMGGMEHRVQMGFRADSALKLGAGTHCHSNMRVSLGPQPHCCQLSHGLETAAVHSNPIVLASGPMFWLVVKSASC